MMGWYGEGVTGWGYALMTVCMVLLLGLVIFGVIAFVRYVGRGDRTNTVYGPSPEQLLAERFARGEIDEQDYRQRLDVLRAPVAPVDEILKR